MSIPNLYFPTYPDDSNIAQAIDPDTAFEQLNKLPIFDQIVLLRRHCRQHYKAILSDFVRDWVSMNVHQLPKSDEVLKALEEQVITYDPLKEEK